MRTQSPGCRETLPRALIHRNALAPQPTPISVTNKLKLRFYQKQTAANKYRSSSDRLTFQLVALVNISMAD